MSTEIERARDARGRFVAAPAVTPKPTLWREIVAFAKMVGLGLLAVAGFLLALLTWTWILGALIVVSVVFGVIGFTYWSLASGHGVRRQARARGRR